jgi:hypothetical protein
LDVLQSAGMLASTGFRGSFQYSLVLLQVNNIGFVSR